MEWTPLRSSLARFGALGVLGVVAIVAVLAVDGGGGASDAPASVEVPAPRYLALGDSVAVGIGATDPRLSGYVALFRDALARRTAGDLASAAPRVEATNLAVGGETTASLITDGQLDDALRLLERSDDAARHIITLTIGGNDATRLLPICGANPEAQPTEACQAAADAVLGTLGENLVTILTNLREAAGPDALIIVSTYYNSLQNPSCLVHQLASLAAPIIGRLNATIVDAASAVHGVRVADVASAGIGPSDLRADCLHPNDSGYARIAAAFLAALEPASTVR